MNWIHSAVLVMGLAAPVAPPSILGRWEGTSICTRGAWNAACHDEVTRYDVTPDSAHAGGVLVASFKRVGADWESMGVLACHADADGVRWACPFENSRVRITWYFAASKPDSLSGSVIVHTAGNQVGRQVRAHFVSRLP